MTLEEKLIEIAQCDNDVRANRAMKILRDRYDQNYGWCEDCDFLVVKETDCCVLKDYNFSEIDKF